MGMVFVLDLCAVAYRVDSFLHCGVVVWGVYLRRCFVRFGVVSWCLIVFFCVLFTFDVCFVGFFFPPP